MKIKKIILGVVVIILFLIVTGGVSFLLLKDNKDGNEYGIWTNLMEKPILSKVKNKKEKENEDVGKNNYYQGYYKDYNSIYFTYYDLSMMGSGEGVSGVNIKDANKRTFRVIKNIKDTYIKMAIDKNNVYYMGRKIEGADPKTFKIFKNSNEYTKDKNNVYYYYLIIEHADPMTFKIYNPTLNVNESLMGFGKDRNNVYYFDKKLEGANPKTFCVNPAKFRTLNRAIDCIIDNKTVYLGLKIIKEADSESFIKVGEDTSFFKDKNYVYYKNKKITNIDSATFKIIDDYMYKYVKDKNFVFKVDSRNKVFSVVSGANPKTSSCYKGSCSLLGANGKKLEEY